MKGKKQKRKEKEKGYLSYSMINPRNVNRRDAAEEEALPIQRSRYHNLPCFWILTVFKLHLSCITQPESSQWIVSSPMFHGCPRLSQHQEQNYFHSVGLLEAVNPQQELQKHERKQPFPSCWGPFDSVSNCKEYFCQLYDYWSPVCQCLVSHG